MCAIIYQEPPNHAASDNRCFCWLHVHRHDRLLHRSLTHTLTGTFPQPFDITYRRCAEELLVLVVEIRGVVIPHAITGACGVESLAKYKAARLLKPQLLLKLQYTHCG